MRAFTNLLWRLAVGILTVTLCGLAAIVMVAARKGGV